MSEKCEHKNFTADATVSRMEDTGMLMLEIKVNCNECGLPFTFVGVEAGMSFEEPMASLDGQELRAPLVPKDSRIFPAVPGFKVRAH